MADIGSREGRSAFRKLVMDAVPQQWRTRVNQLLDSVVFSVEPILRGLAHFEVRSGSGAPTPSSYPDEGFGVWIDEAGSAAYVVLHWAGSFYIVGGSGAGSLPVHTHSHTGGQITDVGTNTHAQIDSHITVVNAHVADGTIHFTKASIDHTGIQNIGSNSHAAIDSHIANSAIHFSTVTYKQLVPLDVYVDVKERLSEWDIHGGILSLATAQPLDSVPTDINVTNGLSKILIVVNAGSDTSGTITVTGTSVDRNTGAETGSDTDDVTISGLTTDNSDTDASGNTRHAFVNAYITSKWFLGAITLSTSDLTLTDVDVYQVSFEQVNDEPLVEIKTLDLTALATNTSAWFYGYLYSLKVTGSNCDLTREASLELPASKVAAATRSFRLRRGQLNISLNGTTDGFWFDGFPGPLANTYWEDINIKVWAEVTKTAALS